MLLSIIDYYTFYLLQKHLHVYLRHAARAFAAGAPVGNGDLVQSGKMLPMGTIVSTSMSMLSSTFTFADC